MYESNPDRAPDTEFVPGELGHLVVGNAGRLLDARRTPITVTGVAPERGEFEVEVGAFEDAGARWQLPIEDVVRFQFGLGASAAPSERVARLQDARTRFSRTTTIDCDPASRASSLRRLTTERSSVRNWLSRKGPQPGDVAGLIARRQGDPRLFALREQFLADRGVGELDRQFSDTFVSNPNSGELIKGHAIVLAELGLCPYHGRVIRHPELFTEPWSKARRAEYLFARLAFTQELFSSWEHETVTLYRGAAIDGPLPARLPSSFVSASFSKDVAAAHFEGGPTTQTAVLWRQDVPISRLFMTFVETPAMNDHFNEAEAVLIGDPASRAF